MRANRVLLFRTGVDDCSWAYCLLDALVQFFIHHFNLSRRHGKIRGDSDPSCRNTWSRYKWRGTGINCTGFYYSGAKWIPEECHVPPLGHFFLHAQGGKLGIGYPQIMEDYTPPVLLPLFDFLKIGGTGECCFKAKTFSLFQMTFQFFQE